MEIKKITFVKKILADGSPCKKCNDVMSRLEESGQMARIDETLIADERDPTSAGMLIAAEHQVERAPFFLVETVDGSKKIYTVYFKFVREVLEKAQPSSAENDTEELKEIMDNQDLDFL